MKRVRAAGISVFLMLAALILRSPASAADEYPTKPIRLIVPFAAGGNTDLVARLIAQYLSRRLGQEVFVDNRPGGNTVVGTSVAAHAAPDGYTLLLTTLSLAVNPSVYRKLPYDTLKDFTPITLAVTMPNVLVVNPSLPARSVKDLVAYAKANPGKLNFSESGVATSPDLSLRLLNLMAGVNIVTVPFKGGGPAMVAVIGGQVQGQFVGLPAAIPYIQSKELRALAVTSRKRATSAPNIPTVAETVPGYESDNWFAVVAPAGTSPALVSRLQADISEVLHSPELKDRLVAVGAEPVGSTPQELATMLRSEIQKYAGVVKETGIPVQ